VTLKLIYINVTSENTEVAITNGQSRETGNINQRYFQLVYVSSGLITCALGLIILYKK